MIPHFSCNLSIIMDAEFGATILAFNALKDIISTKTVSAVKFKDNANNSIDKKEFVKNVMKAIQ